MSKGMASTLDTDSGTIDPGLSESEATPPPKRLSRALRTYAFLVAVILLPQGVGTYLRDAVRTRRFSLLDNVRRYRI